jgi:hypothetical protein
MKGCDDEKVPDGHYIHLSEGELTDNTTREDISNIFNKIESENVQIVVAHFHGGLVSSNAAYKNPMKKIDPDGFNKSMFEVYADIDEDTGKNRAYPIFFIWESGFLETLRSMFLRIDEDTIIGIFKELKKKILRVEEAKSIINEFLDDVGTPTLEEDFLDDYTDVYRKWPREKQIELKEAIEGEIINATNELNNNCPRENTSVECLKKVASVVYYSLLQRSIMGRHHRLTVTMQEEILNILRIKKELFGVEMLLDFGKVAKDGWGTMKCNTVAAFQNDGTKYGGTAFLIELNDLVKNRQKQEQAIKVILVGHSTGAVFICNLLEEAAKEDKYPALADFSFDVIFEAPACTFERFSKTVTNAGDKIGNFRMFTLGKEYERNDKLASFAYSSSMLYLVSSIAEPTRYYSEQSPDCKPENEPPYEYHDKPLVGMEMYLLDERFNYGDEYVEVRNVKNFLGFGNPTGKVKIAFSRADEEAKPGWGITATNHGACDDNVEVLKSIQHIIKHGFHN